MKQFIYGISYLFSCGLLASLPAQAGDWQVTLKTVDGKQSSGVLTDWNSDIVTIANGDATTSIATERLLDLRWQPAPSATKQNAAFLELIDGTRLPLLEYSVADRQATISTPLADEPLVVPTSDIRRVQFTPLIDQINRLWHELEEKHPDGDVLVVHKNKNTTLDYLDGVLGDVSSKQVEFRWEGDEISVKRSKVAALTYYHAQSPELPAPMCWLTTNQGATLPVASAALEESHLQLTTIAGLEFRLPLERIQAADYSVGKLTYLSDLEPLRMKWTPRVELPVAAKMIHGFGEPRNDQSFSGSALSLAWPQKTKQSSQKTALSPELKTYAKGLALRSQTEMIYRLPPKMRRFAATAGIDPTTAQQGNVRLEISTDDQIAWQGEIAGNESPLQIEFDLNGARELRIFVDYGANLDFGDRLHLVDARLTK